MTRRRCPAREGKTEAELAVVDAFDVPACLVFPADRSKPPIALPDNGHGPCEDCLPDPSIREMLSDVARKGTRRVIRRLLRPFHA